MPLHALHDFRLSDRLFRSHQLTLLRRLRHDAGSFKRAGGFRRSWPHLWIKTALNAFVQCEGIIGLLPGDPFGLNKPRQAICNAHSSVLPSIS
ncbi:hypothetical protein D3C80_1815220 [compost metagenome]